MESRVVITLLLCSGVLTGTPEEGIPSPCGDQGTVEVLGARTLDNGEVVARDGSRFPPGCTWNSHPRGSPMVTLGCPHMVKPCLWQCCPEGQALDQYDDCQPNNVTMLPIRVSDSKSFVINNYHVLKGSQCPFMQYMMGPPNTFEITADGALVEIIAGMNISSTVKPGEFCAEITENKTTVLGCCPNEECDESTPAPQDGPQDEITHVIYSIFRIIALPFLVATFVVYAVIPELRNLHGKCLLSHVGSLTVAYLFLLIIQLASKHIWSWLCVTSAFVVYFFLMVNFFWLNVMCFDIWWTFSGSRGITVGRRKRDQKQFLMYSLYSWGSGFFMLCVAAFLEFSSSVPDSITKPGFGIYRCWFKDKSTNLAYFSGPVGVIILSNIIFFAFTAYTIFKIKRETAVLSGGESRRSDFKKDNKRFVLYLKLFVVMGVTWSLDLLSWAIGGPDRYWYVTDIANITQGIPIFFIFVWKRSVRKLLREKFCKKLPTTEEETPTGSTTTAGSSIPMS